MAACGQKRGAIVAPFAQGIAHIGCWRSRFTVIVRHDGIGPSDARPRRKMDARTALAAPESLSPVDAAWFRMEASKSPADILGLLVLDGHLTDAELHATLERQFLLHLRGVSVVVWVKQLQQPRLQRALVPRMLM